MLQRRPIGAAELARELGVPPRELRRWLLAEFPRPPEERGRPWLLSRRQTRAARRRFRPRGHRRRWGRLALAAGALLLVAALAAAGLAGAAYWQAQELVDELQAGPKREVVDAARQELDIPPRRPAVPVEPGPAKTILLIGSDERLGMPGDRRSDTILLARVDPRQERIALLSVPRDLLVEIPGHGRDRVNSAYERGGVALLAETLRETLGVEINHFFEADFGGFQGLVAALGGVYLPVDGRYFNRNLGTPGTNFAEIDLLPGYQRLDGSQALSFVRFRHYDSDLVRSARQQLFLREAGRQLVAARYDVRRLRGLLRGLAEATTSDVDEVGTLWRLLRAVEQTPSSRVDRLTIPAQETVAGGAAYLTADEERIRRTVADWHGGAPAAPPAEPAREEPPRRLQPGPPGLVGDGGRGRALVAGLGSAAACAPTALPPGFWWPSSEPARAYELAGRPAVALWATRGSGSSILWTMTSWPDPPALADPTRRVERNARTYELWLETGRVRQVAWTLGDVRAWITNTLRNDLDAETMLQLADSCR